MTSSITYSLVPLTIDGVTSLSRLMGVQNVCKSPNKSYGNNLFETAESFSKTLKDSFIFFIFLCVRIEINSHWQ